MSLDLDYQNAYRAHQAGNLGEAERAYRDVLARDPLHADANRLLGVLLLDRGDAAEADSHFREALRVRPDHPNFQQNHAMALAALGDWEGSLAALERALSLKADFTLAWFNRGNALMNLLRYEDAIKSFQRAIALGLRDAAPWYAIGHAFMAMNTRDETSHWRQQALTCFQQAIQLKPDLLEAVNNCGTLLLDLERYAEALAYFDRALVLDPHSANAHSNRGLVLDKLKRLPEALQAFRAAMAFAPDLPYVRGLARFTAQHLCDWKDFDAECAALFDSIEARRIPAAPFQLLCLPSSPALQRDCAALFAEDQYPPRALPPSAPAPHERLRIAYVGACFGAHPVAVLIAETLERHDRTACEFFGVSVGADDKSTMRARMAGALEHFIDAHGVDDRQVAQNLRELGIDIAVDLDGYTQNCRAGIFSYRPAPLQVNYLGYPGTLGSDHYDYLIGDDVVTPPEHAAHFSEAVIVMPGAYQPNGTRPDAPAVTRTQAGLPETGFVFGCFNHNYKITPDVFDSWMRILGRVPASVLWLFANNPAAQDNLRREAQDRGIDPTRLVFAPQLQQAEHLARLRQMDLFLDTYIYGAHTTASDALWCEVPVLTRLGQAFPSRVAASLLTRMKLAELIMKSSDAYEDRAVALAEDPGQIAQLKQKIRAARDTSQLFDAAQFARHLETAFHAVAARHRHGLAPESFAVNP